MPKMKTKKAARKRFKISKNGKVRARKSLRRHMMADRTPKKRRQTRGWHPIGESDAHRFKIMLPYG
jgi:large subunit ribosomal protein L35